MGTSQSSSPKQYANKVIRIIVRLSKEIVAVPFDKGRGFCSMQRPTYNARMDICDLPQFQRLGKEGLNAKKPVLVEKRMKQMKSKKVLVMMESPMKF